VKSFIKIVDRVNDIVGLVLGVISLVIMLTVVYEVIARYVFNAPTMWSMEINLYLFCAICVMGGGYCLLKDGHVRVDLIYPKLFARERAIIEFCTYPLALLFCGILIWLGGREAWTAIVEHQVSESVMAFPLWPVWTTIPIGGFLLAMQIIARLLKDLLEIKEATGDTPS